MAQIFVSHSAKDRDLVALLSRAFAATKVKGVFEEFEAILNGPANALHRMFARRMPFSFCWGRTSRT